MIMKSLRKVLLVIAIAALLFTLCACDKNSSTNNSGETVDGTTVWYLGGNNIFAGDIDVKSLFEGVEDTVEPDKIYNSVKLNEKMLYGAYTLNNKDKDIETVRKEIPFEEVNFKSGSVKISSVPIGVYFGSDNICSSSTGFKYGDFTNVTDCEVAVLEFATEEKIGTVICSYEVSDNSLTFKQLEQTSKDGEKIAYQLTGIEFKYNFNLSGPYITLSKNGSNLKLTAYCFTSAADKDLSLSGYSLVDSPLIDDLDYFASAKAWNYAVRRDGSYYDLSAYKITDDGKFTVYLADKDSSGKTNKFVQQYAYIIQSDASDFLTSFSIILLDGNKEYYYTDSITKREARVLEDQGVDVDNISEEKIKEIAEKKADLFDELYNEFEANGIKVNINRSTGEIAMDASVLFGGDSAVITNDGKDLLNKFLAAYTSIIYNDKYDGFISKTLVEGHIAPVTGSTYESGLSLSQERADNVKNYCLSSETGVDTSKLGSTLEAVGLSNSKPIYNSNGEIDMAACRRVSFRFLVNLDE